ncbi:MAG: DUF2283 domain-containing protein [Calditrichaceae bacterium]|nr:DUF2283 domain-containing protein [Calditrichia bacterium]NUQ42379.1 DUF2283 domain-containing protein [Calditrichaceae bacterium]
MKVLFDEKADAIYIRFDESKIIESEEIKHGIIFDFDGKEHVVGIEILKVTARVPLNNLKKLQFEVV